jgi:hypothetical protein
MSRTEGQITAVLRYPLRFFKDTWVHGPYSENFNLKDAIIQAINQISYSHVDRAHFYMADEVSIL